MKTNLLLLTLSLFFFASCNLLDPSSFRCIDNLNTKEYTLEDNISVGVPNIVLSHEHSDGRLNFYLYATNNGEPERIIPQSVSINITDRSRGLSFSSSELIERDDDYSYTMWVNEDDYEGRAKLECIIEIDDDQRIHFSKSIQFTSCENLLDCDTCDLLNCIYFNQIPHPEFGSPEHAPSFCG